MNGTGQEWKWGDQLRAYGSPQEERFQWGQREMHRLELSFEGKSYRTYS